MTESKVKNVKLVSKLKFLKFKMRSPKLTLWAPSHHPYRSQSWRSAEYIDYSTIFQVFDSAVTRTHNLPFGWRALYLYTTNRLVLIGANQICPE